MPKELQKKTVKGTSGTSDQSLTADVSGGGTSLEALYKSHWQNLCGWLYRRYGAGPPEPEDIAQLTFSRVAQAMKSKAIANPKAFIFTTARNIYIDEKRKLGTRSKYEKDIGSEKVEEVAGGFTPENVLIDRERFAILKTVLKRMPQNRRLMLLLSRFHGLSSSQISKKMGVSETTVRKHVKSGVLACIDALAEASDDPALKEEGGDE